MSFTAQDPDFIKRVTESFRRQPFMEYLRATLHKVEPGYCEIHLAYDKTLSQQHGFFHAGIVGTIADNAAGYASYSLMAATSSVLAVEFKLNLVNPADGDMLIGQGQVIKYGRTLTVCRSDVFVIKNGAQKLCAASQSTMIELKDTADTPKA